MRLVTDTRKGFPRKCDAKNSPLMAWLLASVPPDVKTISVASQQSSAATCDRSLSQRRLAPEGRPNAGEGLPYAIVKNGDIAATTSGANGVLAL